MLNKCQKNLSFFHMVAEQCPWSRTCLPSTTQHPTATHQILSSSMASLERDLLHRDPHALPDHLWQAPPSTSSSRTVRREHRLRGIDEHHVWEFGGILPRHPPALTEVCHQVFVDHLVSGASPLETFLPSTATLKHAAAAFPIETTAGTAAAAAAAAAAATTSSSSRPHIWCAAAVTTTTSPMRNINSRNNRNNNI